jgi:hypothetical protein
MPQKKKQSNKVTIIVTVSPDHPIHDVTKELEAAGLEVDQVMEAISTVTGSADPEATKRLRAVRGVTDVAKDHPVDIGPPGTPIS